MACHSIWWICFITSGLVSSFLTFRYDRLGSRYSRWADNLSIVPVCMSSMWILWNDSLLSIIMWVPVRHGVW
jgi:hypothetical protein